MLVVLMLVIVILIMLVLIIRVCGLRLMAVAFVVVALVLSGHHAGQNLSYISSLPSFFVSGRSSRMIQEESWCLAKYFVTKWTWDIEERSVNSSICTRPELHRGLTRKRVRSHIEQVDLE